MTAVPTGCGEFEEADRVRFIAAARCEGDNRKRRREKTLIGK
jgi:hypothetical protein